MPRKQKKYHYIYKTTCQVTGKFYVGMHSTDDLDDGYLGSGKILGYSIGKHGRENHKKEILEFCETRNELKKREAEIVNEELLTDPLCINLKYGGDGGWDHVMGVNIQNQKVDTVSRTKKAVSTRCERWKTDITYRTRYSDKLSLAAIGNTAFQAKTHTLETRIQIGLVNSIHQRGEKNSQFGTCWVTNGTPIKIKKERLDEYLANGYRRGRK